MPNPRETAESCRLFLRRNKNESKTKKIITPSKWTLPVSSVITKGLFVITAWHLFATTVHPWYICLPVAVSIFTHYRYAIIWSYLTTLSYYAYQSKPVKENLWLIAFSYLIVAAFAFWEFRNKEIRFGNTSHQNYKDELDRQ